MSSMETTVAVFFFKFCRQTDNPISGRIDCLTRQRFVRQKYTQQQQQLPTAADWFHNNKKGGGGCCVARESKRSWWFLFLLASWPKNIFSHHIVQLCSAVCESTRREDCVVNVWWCCCWCWWWWWWCTHASEVFLYPISSLFRPQQNCNQIPTATGILNPPLGTCRLSVAQFIALLAALPVETNMPKMLLEENVAQTLLVSVFTSIPLSNTYYYDYLLFHPNRLELSYLRC